MTRHYLPPLHVHILCRAKDGPARTACTEVERLFEGGEPLSAVESLDIPTFAIPQHEGGLGPIPWDAANDHAVIVFIDDAMFEERDFWETALDALAAAADANARRAHVLTVTDDPGALAALCPALAARQVIRVPKDAPAGEDLGKHWGSTVLLHTLRALADRLALPEEGLGRLFLSHAKADGAWLADALRDFVDRRSSGLAFFDKVSLRAGEDFEEGLHAGFDGAVVVALLTDHYSNRYWCNWEVVTGKDRRCPFLAVDLLTQGEVRSLRYAGNARTMRWLLPIPQPEERERWAPREDQRDPESEAKRFAMQRIVQNALAELLRWRHDRARVAAARATGAVPAGAVVLGGPPELATLPEFQRDRTWQVVHPDPPLAVPERKLIERMRPDVNVTSLTEALAGWVKTETGKPLRIAVSISDPPDVDLADRGLTKSHLKRLWSRIALQFLLIGAELGYGGDLRQQGYTELLGDLLMSLASVQRGPREGAVESYLGWPTWVSIDAATWKKYLRSVRWHRMLPPGGLDVPEGADLAPRWTIPEVQLGWTVSMLAMRRRMAREHDARVMVGGQHRAVSPVPGLVDELTTFLDLGKPVYLLGGFGGMTSVLARTILGESPRELTLAYQDDEGKRTAIREHIDRAAATRTFTEAGDKGKPAPAEPIPIPLAPTDFPALVARLQKGGTDALNNGLTRDENEQLFATRDPVEAISLVLRGLTVAGAAKKA
jgi:hypothetical protein